MPRYGYECKGCETRFDVERPISEATAPQPCPFCGTVARRLFTVPKFLFKHDPRDNLPVWHNHGGYGHAHARGRGFHGRGKGDE